MQSIRFYSGLVLLTATLGFSGGAQAQLFPQAKLPQQTGEAIYKGVCQTCHMPDAKGAVGAGTYPALANNSKLEVSGYPVAVVIHGQKAMPSFGQAMSDEQVANIVNYVRTHFGNNYKDSVTPDDVKAAR
ncbi:MAG TPA: cytochrome c [Rhizomicrobium sp.]|nr:cytochrome c [Rhizomicrobium sp.]